MDIINNNNIIRTAKRIGILGGSFNPIHIGHLRMAIEVFERFQPSLEYIDLVPCARPPHKNIANLLPFDFRVELLKSAVAHIDCLKININEYLRDGPSYTYDTLLEYNTKFSCAELFFIIGEKDFLSIQSWYKGLSIPDLTNIIIIAQNKHNNIDFTANVLNFWADATCNFKNNMAIFSLAKTSIFYLNLPQLEISASMIREHYKQGLNISYLSPDKVIELLYNNKELTNKHWGIDNDY